MGGWEKALEYAEAALDKSPVAEVMRRHAIVDEAFRALKLRYNFCQKIQSSLQTNLSTVDAVPIAEEYMNSPLMHGWDDSKVAKV